MEQTWPKITKKKSKILEKPVCALPGFSPNQAMRPTDNDPKGNDPVDRDPTNEEIVAYLQRGSMHFCKVLQRNIGKPCPVFEFRTDFFQGMQHHFQAMFVDMKDYKVLCTTTADEFDKYPRAHALKSLLHGKCFPSVEAFAVACRNALGDNIETFDLAGYIFVDGKCVDEIIDALDAKAHEEKELAKELATEVKQLTAEVKALEAKLKLVVGLIHEISTEFYSMQIEKDKTQDEKLKDIVCTEEVAQVFWQFFCERQPMQTVS